MSEFEYPIGGKTFIQKKLVLGQWRQLQDVIRDVRIVGEINTQSVLVALGPRIFAVLAVILIEEGGSPEGKDLEALAREIEWGIDPADALRAIADFFALNPVASLLENMRETIGTLIRTIDEVTAKLKEIGSKDSATPSPAETSPGGTGSSGT
ncbi:MAG: hypothetical protein LLG97_19360 [Deltaproteobacteria bacterium]|nr:hypothetical protein [Deltaproteobacteria bacterium]